MNGRDLVLLTLAHEVPERTPWVPYTGVHVGSLIGAPADQVLRDADTLVKGLLKAVELYSPDGIPVVFDLQVEAEILGCGLLWSPKAPPSVASHPFAGRKGLPHKLPERRDGRLPLILDAMARAKAEVGKRVALYGLVTGPLTLASHLRGTDLFLDMFDDPPYVHELLEGAARVGRRMIELYVEAGMDVLAVVDPMLSQISPEAFESFAAAPLRGLFAAVRQSGRRSSLFVCGDASRNIAAMARVGADCLSVDENIDMEAAKRITDEAGVTLSGNIPLATVMLLGSQADNQSYALHLMERMGRRDFILAPGCDLPYDVPPANLVGIAQAVHDESATRAYLAAYVHRDLEVPVEMPDYEGLKGALVEVFTVDSATCAACGYLKAAAEAAAAGLDGVEVVERKTSLAENAARARKLGIAHLPAILINGKLAASSIIPDRRALREAIAAEALRRREPASSLQ